MTVEAWGRSGENPIGGWYGLKKGLRGRFGMYIPPLMDELGRAEVEHSPLNNRMRARLSGTGPLPERISPLPDGIGPLLDGIGSLPERYASWSTMLRRYVP